MYIVDSGGLYEVDPSGSVTEMTTDRELDWAVTAVADPSGNVYVVELERQGGGRNFLEIDAAGTVSSAGAIVDGTEALAEDASGNVHRNPEATGGQVWKFHTGSAQIELIAGIGEPGSQGEGFGVGHARLWLSGIAVNSSGNVWFTDHRNRRVRLLEPLRGVVVPYLPELHRHTCPGS